MIARRLLPESVEAERGAPAPERLIKGNPQFTTWASEEFGPVSAGIWEASPGAWAVSYDEWEYCKILSGRSVVVGADGRRLDLSAGDTLIIRPGFRGIWEVIETTRKEYVIVAPEVFSQTAADR